MQQFNIAKMTDALMQNVHAVHICNWDEYASSLRAMLLWMVAYDNNINGRWLPDFWTMLIRLSSFRLNLLSPSQAIPTPTYMAWDLRIECTVNKGSKIKSG